MRSARVRRAHIPQPWVEPASQTDSDPGDCSQALEADANVRPDEGLKRHTWVWSCTERPKLVETRRKYTGIKRLSRPKTTGPKRLPGNRRLERLTLHLDLEIKGKA
jgi:hypothetical protein